MAASPKEGDSLSLLQQPSACTRSPCRSSSSAGILTCLSCVGFSNFTNNVVRSCLQAPCHIQKSAFYTSPCISTFLIFFLSHFFKTPWSLNGRMLVQITYSNWVFSSFYLVLWPVLSLCNNHYPLLKWGFSELRMAKKSMAIIIDKYLKCSLTAWKFSRTLMGGSPKRLVIFLVMGFWSGL